MGQNNAATKRSHRPTSVYAGINHGEVVRRKEIFLIFRWGMSCSAAGAHRHGETVPFPGNHWSIPRKEEGLLMARLSTFRRIAGPLP